MPSKNNRDDLIGVRIKDRYRIISRLGAGGMGTAYRAWDEQAGVPVVIKIPKKLFFEDPKFAERFFREIRLLQGLNHPHIVPIQGVGAHENGLPFVVLRFLPGGSLSNRRRRNQQSKPIPGPPGMLHLWLPAIADALDFVHSQGVVHRDVKPANVFFDAFWGAFLGDFGIAKIVEESDTFDKEHTLTATHMGIGTPEYMAPEQFAPKAVIEGRADQYALAVIAYEMLAGRRPFTGATAHLIVEVTTQQAPPLQAIRRDLPSSLLNAVHRGLAKRPEERFASCRDFATAVLQDVPLFDDEPDIARLLCPKCAKILKLPLEAGGKRGTCPRCQTTMEVAHNLGALWLLDEAPRQRKVAVSTDTSETEPLAGVIWAIDQTEGEEEALEAFKPVSNTTPIERAARSLGWKASPLAIWSGVAVALLAALAFWAAISSEWFRTNPDPGTLVDFHDSIGRTLLFAVVGTGIDMGIYGSNPYTADSSLASTAVHSGVLQPGESGVVTVTILPGQQIYAGSLRNGVTSGSCGQHSLSYRIEKNVAFGVHEVALRERDELQAVICITSSAGMHEALEFVEFDEWREDLVIEDIESWLFNQEHAFPSTVADPAILVILQTDFVVDKSQADYLLQKSNVVGIDVPSAQVLSEIIQAASIPAEAGPSTAKSNPDPGDLRVYEASVGKTLSFRVIGNALNGGVWGSNPYTADSRLSHAAVHAGALRPGEPGVVRVTILPGQQSYASSTRNGVTTRGWGAYGLSYRIERAEDAN